MRSTPRMKCFLLVLPLAAVTSLVSAAEPGDDVCRLMRRLIDDGQVAGAQVVVGDAERLLRVESFGVRSVEDATPVDRDTMFCIGSCSKMVSAAVVMTLVADGKVGLDTPIDRWLDEFSAMRVEEETEITRAPTLRELLCHRGGVYTQRNRMTADQTRWIRDFELTLAESAQGIARERLIAEPGGAFAYSGAGYCVLGRVAEVAAATPFDELLAAKICRPLGLSKTTYFPPLGHENVAVGHAIRDGRPMVDRTSPHLKGTSHNLPLIGGSIYSPAHEVARFAQLLLNRGTFRGHAVLTREGWSEMTAAQSPRETGPYGFGLSVVLDERSGEPQVLSHGGSLSGYRCQILVDLSTGRFGVVNYTGSAPKGAVQAALATWVSRSE